jgi:hypothetical protein
MPRSTRERDRTLWLRAAARRNDINVTDAVTYLICMLPVPGATLRPQRTAIARLLHLHDHTPSP